MIFIRMRQIISGAIILFLGLNCSPNKPLTSQAPDPAVAGMHFINAAGKSFLQGAHDSLAGVDEQPVMQSGFTYNFWIDTTEVTQGEYFAITGIQPVAPGSSSGAGDNFPVYNVSWYDAVLFCNAKSVRMGLDTVYSYFSLKRLASGSVYDLTGLMIHYDRGGIRLPTEAEWEFTAREGTSTIPFPHLANKTQALASAWYDSNASGQAHPVAQLRPNAFGVYDLEGNVFEWTGDWKGPYLRPSITNSIGAMQPDIDFEKVIKGGAYTHGFVSLRPSRRSATYPTAIATTTRYIGFRCARGIVPGGMYIQPDSVSSVVTNAVGLITGNVLPALGTSRARLVFVNRTGTMNTLCFVDFGQSNPQVHEFTDSQDVYGATISPDGKYAAYSTRGEDFGGSARGYLRSLDSLDKPPVPIGGDSVFNPRFWIDRQQPDTFCVFTNSAIDDNSPAWPGTQTFMQKVSGGKPLGKPSVFISQGSYHDGVSWDGGYAVTGYTRLIMRDLVAQQDRQLFTYPQNGKSTQDPGQVCNVSMCLDSSVNDRCMFLDFGSSSVSSLTGTSYGIHQYAFIADFSGKTFSWFKCPQGEASWDYMRWSNVPRFAIACGSNDAGEPHAIYLMDLDNRIYTKLVEGVSLAYPSLWVGQAVTGGAEGLSLDSLGQYNDPPLSSVEAGLAIKLHGFWQVHNDLEIAVVGDSRPAYGVDPTRITGHTTYNMGVGGGDFIQTLAIVNDYVLLHCPKIKMIIMNCNIGTFYDPNIGNNWNTGMALSKGYNYDKNHGFWRDGLPMNFDSLAASVAPPQIWTPVDSLGFSSLACNGWGAVVPVSGPALAWDTTDPNYLLNFSRLVSLAQTASALNVHVLIVEFPMNPLYGQAAFYSEYGPSQQTAHEIFNQFKELEANYPFVNFYDANNYGNHSYGDDDAYNEAHLCGHGAGRLSDSLNVIIRRILR